MAGAATCVTFPAMKKMYRDMSRARRDRRAYVGAHRAVARSMTGGYVDERAEHRVALDCFHMCGDCGYLAPDRSAACPFCSGDNWLDLDDVTIAETIRSGEDNDRKKVPFVASLIAYGMGAVISGASIAAVYAFTSFQHFAYKDEMNIGLWLTGTCIMVGAAVGTFARRHVAKRMRGMGVHRPIRWRLPATAGQLGKRSGTPIAGIANGEARLTAPFSGRPCIGYKASVLFDAHGDARPPEWVLEEVHSESFAVDELNVDKGALLIEGTGTPVEPEGEEQIKAMKKFLRQRGLHIEDGSFWYFETILTHGDTVVGTRYPERQLVSLQVRKGD